MRTIAEEKEEVKTDAKAVKPKRRESPTKSRKGAINPEDLKARVESYFTEHLAESGEIADIESLADYLGTTRDGLLTLMNDKRCGETLRRARNRIAMIKKQLAFNGKIPASVLSFDLKNNHGYRDKPEEGEPTDNAEQIVFKGKAADWAK